LLALFGILLARRLLLASWLTGLWPGWLFGRLRRSRPAGRSVGVVSLLHPARRFPQRLAQLARVLLGLSLAFLACPLPLVLARDLAGLAVCGGRIDALALQSLADRGRIGLARNVLGRFARQTPLLKLARSLIARARRALFSRRPA